MRAQFTALRYFALDDTDHASHQEQASMICRSIIWRSYHTYDEGCGSSEVTPPRRLLTGG